MAEGIANHGLHGPRSARILEPVPAVAPTPGKGHPGSAADADADVGECRHRQAPPSVLMQARNASSARSRASAGPPHQYAISCSMQQAAQVPSGHIEHTSVVKSRGGRSQAGLCRQQTSAAWRSRVRSSISLAGSVDRAAAAHPRSSTEAARTRRGVRLAAPGPGGHIYASSRTTMLRRARREPGAALPPRCAPRPCPGPM